MGAASLTTFTAAARLLSADFKPAVIARVDDTAGATPSAGTSTAGTVGGSNDERTAHVYVGADGGSQIRERAVRAPDSSSPRAAIEGGAFTRAGAVSRADSPTAKAEAAGSQKRAAQASDGTGPRTAKRSCAFAQWGVDPQTTFAQRGVDPQTTFAQWGVDPQAIFAAKGQQGQTGSLRMYKRLCRRPLSCPTACHVPLRRLRSEPGGQ